MFNFFKKPDIDFKFADLGSGGFYTKYPPVLARTLKPAREYQEKKYNEYRFPSCPGMLDYSRLGYIIPAWTNFHIKANKAGTVVMAGSRGEAALKRINLAPQPIPMEKEIIDGTPYYKGEENYQIYNCGGPWKIVSYNKDLSLLVMPAFFHSNFLDDLHVIPGIVDYVGGFYDINFIIMPRRECELEIHAGEPLLHIIPLVLPKIINASYGKATQFERDAIIQPKNFHESNFYRKFFHIKKKFKLTPPTNE